MDTTKNSAFAHRTIDRNTRAGDPFAHVGEKVAWRTARWMAGIFDGRCDVCRAESAGFGHYGELCERCAREEGVL